MGYTDKSAPTQRKILIVEDDLRSQRLLRNNLEPLGYRVMTTTKVAEVEDLLAAFNPDIVIVDIILTDGTGFDACHIIRSVSLVPIIILSSSGQSKDKLRPFDLRVDDYVVKPYDPDELVARIEAVLRRSNAPEKKQATVVHTGPITIDFQQHLVTLHGKDIKLSPTEYKIVEHLADNIGRTILSNALITYVWGEQSKDDYALLHIYISRIRKKLRDEAYNAQFIVTKPGIGYTMPLFPPDD